MNQVFGWTLDTPSKMLHCEEVVKKPKIITE